MKKNKKLPLNIKKIKYDPNKDVKIPDYIISIGKCKSYFGSYETNNLFFMNFKGLNNKKHRLLLESIEFNIKKMKSAKITVESIYKMLKLREDKTLFLKMIMEDECINLLDSTDLDFLKEKFNGEYNNDKYFKSIEYIIDVLKFKNNDKVEIKFKTPNINTEINFDKYSLEEYLYVIREILKISIISEAEIEKTLNENIPLHFADKIEEWAEINHFHRIQSIEKIKKYENRSDFIKELKEMLNLEHQCHILYDVTYKYFIDSIKVEDFYNALPSFLPSLKKKNISQLLYNGFTYNFEFSASLINEIDYFLRIKYNIPIKEIYNFNVLIKNLNEDSISRRLSEDFDVRNQISHGIFSDRDLGRLSFIIYIIALHIFIGF